MRKVIAEFLTTESFAPKSYGDSGCMLTSLQETALVLRHEHYTQELNHRIYLFARDPEMGAQVFIYIYPTYKEKGRDEYKKDMELYIKQKKNSAYHLGRVSTRHFLLLINVQNFNLIMLFVRVMGNIDVVSFILSLV